MNYRLSDLKPKWVTLQGWSHPDRPYYIGMTFLCPHCPTNAPEHGQDRRRRLAVPFYPHIDPTNAAATFACPIPRKTDDWTRVSGETFADITIAPSVNYEAIGHWHGSIVNGEVK